MPEDTVIEDEVISQDDIDKLLNASVQDEDNDDNEKNAGPVADADDELAELSQDDIDNLLSGGPLGSDSLNNEPDDVDEPDVNGELNSELDTDSDTEDEDTDGLELISQNDIDNLMDGMEATEEPGTLETVTETETDDDDTDEDEDEDDLELFSQEDISKLMSNPVPSSESSESFPGPELIDSDNEIDSDMGIDLDSETDPDYDTISKSTTDLENQTEPENQADTQNQADLESGAENTDVLELVSQDDIDKLMNQQSEDDEGTEQEIIEEKNEEILNSEKILSESDAVDIEACMITQDTIDQLIKDDIDGDTDAVSDEVLDSEVKPDPEQILEQDIDIEAEKDFKESEGSDSKSVPEITTDDEGDSTEPSDVAENDLDSILKDSPESVEGESENGSNLISQDDIDALLQGTEEEDEDVLGDIDADAGLNNQDMDNDPDTDIDEQENQVVIEEVEKDENGDSSVSTPSVDEVQPGKKEKKKKLKKKWYRSKFMLAGFGIVLLLLSIGSGYYFFIYGPALKARLHDKKTNLQANSDVKGKTENINSNLSDLPQVIVPQGPGSVAMKDFIVFSKVTNKNFTYLSVDLSVHYSNGQAFDEIKKHLPFYRGVIYDAIEKKMLSDTKKEISEKNLSEVIKKALNQVMLKKYIDQVLFTSFKTG